MKRAIVLILVLAVLLTACAPKEAPKISQTQAAETVYKYFDAWSRQNYTEMYSLISDGFKKIEPTAKTLQDFEAYAKKQGITKIRINSIIDKQNTGEVAVIDYDVTLTINGQETPFQSTFTVKKKPYDSPPGWKLIHPYGENIDTT